MRDPHGDSHTHKMDIKTSVDLKYSKVLSTFVTTDTEEVRTLPALVDSLIEHVLLQLIKFCVRV